MLAGLAATVPVPQSQALTVVRAVYAKGLLRVMYGDAFLEPLSESADAHLARVIGIAQALAAAR